MTRRRHLRDLLPFGGLRAHTPPAPPAAPPAPPATLTFAATSATLTAELGPSAVEAGSRGGRFELLAYTGGVMHPELGAAVDWSGPVVVDSAGVRYPDAVPVHRDHDPTRPVGHATVTTTGGEIRAAGSFSVPSTDAAEVAESGRRGFPWKASIGLSEMRWQKIPAGQTVTANGRDFVGPLLVVTSATLHEISFVSVAGDPQATAEITARQPVPHPAPGVPAMSFAQWVASLGLSLAALPAQAVSQLRARFGALQASGEVAVLDPPAADDTAAGDDPDTQQATAATSAPAASSAVQPDAPAPAPAPATATAAAGLSADTLTAMRAAAAAEEGRIAAIREIGSRFGDPVLPSGQLLTAHAITQGWTAQQATLEARRVARPASPAIHTTSPDDRRTVETLQAALLLRAGRSPDAVLRAGSGTSAPAWLARPVNDPARQRIMDAAHEFRDLSMVEMVAESLRACGHTVPSGRNRHAILQAGFSTHSISAVFSQSVGAIALMAYAEAGDFSQGWTSESENPNLIETDRPRLVAAQDLTLHEPDGEADHVSRSAVNEKVKVDRFSRQVVVDEVHFINDQFGLLAETPRDFGRAAARLRPNLVAAVMLANANLAATGRALFNTTDLSLITSNALTQPNLQKARANLSKRKDGDASLNLQATHLIVPSDLGDLAVQLTRSAVISADAGAGSTNPIFLRNITPIDEGRLANGVVNPLTGATLAGSLTSWYLVAADAHTIEVQFLQGTGRIPIVTVDPLTGGKFGLSVTVKHFVGAKALDFRGMVRCDA